MAKHRSVGEQIKSGFRIAGLFILTLCTFIALVASLKFMIGAASPSSSSHQFLGGLAASIIVLFMFLTVRYWAKWLVAVVAFACARMFMGLLVKVASAGFFVNLSLTQLLTWTSYFLIATLLTARHVRREPIGAESFSLVAFVIGVALADAYNSAVPLFYGLGFLAAGELGQRLLSYKKRHVHPRIVSAP